MTIAIHHHTSYHYSEEVELSPHLLKFYPRLTMWQRMKHFNLKITPTPQVIYQGIDQEGNIQHLIGYENKLQKLDIDVTFSLESMSYNPFDFMIFPFSAVKLPFNYSKELNTILSPYLGKLSNSDKLIEYAKHLLSQSNWETINFIVNTMGRINKDVRSIIRPEGEAHDPEITYAAREGSCRDMTMLYQAVLRMFGIATRFVSGYYCDDNSGHHNYLHAWLEAYIPGAGWKGFDPTNNLAVNEHYVTIAASALPELVTPVKGIFTGRAQSSLTTNIEIQVEA